MLVIPHPKKIADSRTSTVRRSPADDKSHLQIGELNFHENYHHKFKLFVSILFSSHTFICMYSIAHSSSAYSIFRKERGSCQCLTR